MLKFERLTVWQKALALSTHIHDLTRRFPKEELYILTSQIKRAANSIALNIAEGSGRTKRDFRNFLRTSRASCYECLAILEVARRQQQIPTSEHGQYRAWCIELTRMISGLMNSLSKEGVIS